MIDKFESKTPKCCVLEQHRWNEFHQSDGSRVTVLYLYRDVLSSHLSHFDFQQNQNSLHFGDFPRCWFYAISHWSKIVIATNVFVPLPNGETGDFRGRKRNTFGASFPPAKSERMNQSMKLVKK